jgi:hypothetical protein
MMRSAERRKIKTKITIRKRIKSKMKMRSRTSIVFRSEADAIR